ncbi:MAG: ABC transporter ATP-binding protein [Variibacter sp.]|nr:ABC transporter ATP-binding protein [Variibacter sp.]
MMSAPLVTVEGVSKQFGGVRAVDAVSFTIAPDEILGLIGPNGAGKSTMFNLISGVQRPTGGEIRLDGERIDGMRPDRICARGVARTFQSASLLAGMTCWENVHLASLFCHPRKGDRRSADERTEAALALCGLAQRAEAVVDEITTGEAKRLEIARAVATKPRLLMTDEVVAGLNPAETDQILAILRRINETGVAVVFVEHDVRAVLALVHRLVVLAQGRVLAEGEPREVARSPAVIEAYLGSRYAEHH